MARRRRVAVCVPSYQERDNIERATRLIDAAVTAADAGTDYVIVNADNRSTDGTAALFIGVATRTPKVSLTTPAGVRGKGANIREFIRYALEHDYDAAVTLDADLRCVPAQWIDALTDGAYTDEPLVSLPLYGRPTNDANHTNHVIVPLLLAATGHPIRQPIGGDFGFNRAFMRSVIAVDWPFDALRFGVDLFFAIHALDHAAYRQVPLDTGKQHGWRNATPEQVDGEFSGKFNQSVRTLVGLLHRRRAGRPPADRPADWRFPPSAPLDSTQARGNDPNFMRAVAAGAHRRHRDNPAYRALLGGGGRPDEPPFLDDDAWAAVLTRAWHAWSGQYPDGFLAAFRALLYCRIASGQADFIALSPEQVDRKVIGVAARIQL